VILVIGEVLVDIFPEYQRIGGAPFNFAFHLKKLGLPVRLITRVGDDRNGHTILAMADENGLDTVDIQIDARYPTGTVQVALDDDGVPQFDILQDVAYDHLDLGSLGGGGNDDVEMTYFGTLLQRTDSGCRQVTDFLTRQGDDGVRFCDINMRPPHVNPRALQESLRHADLLKLNEDELTEIQRRFGGPRESTAIMPWLMKTFNIQNVALTRGGQGSIFIWPDGMIHRSATEIGPIIDTVGAGDGYAAILAAGYLRRLPWETTIEQATRFAGRICGIPGAVPVEDCFYDDFRCIL
jgi:fructokinase